MSQGTRVTLLYHEIHSYTAALLAGKLASRPDRWKAQVTAGSKWAPGRTSRIGSSRKAFYSHVANASNIVQISLGMIYICQCDLNAHFSVVFSLAVSLLQLRKLDTTEIPNTERFGHNNTMHLIRYQAHSSWPPGSKQCSELRWRNLFETSEDKMDFC